VDRSSAGGCASRLCVRVPPERSSVFAVVATTVSRADARYYYLSRRAALEERRARTLRGKSERKQNKIEIDKVAGEYPPPPRNYPLYLIPD